MSWRVITRAALYDYGLVRVGELSELEASTWVTINVEQDGD